MTISDKVLDELMRNISTIINKTVSLSSSVVNTEGRPIDVKILLAGSLNFEHNASRSGRVSPVSFLKIRGFNLNELYVNNILLKDRILTNQIGIS